MNMSADERGSTNGHANGQCTNGDEMCRGLHSDNTPNKGPHYVPSRNEISHYWKNALVNCECCPFPALPTSVKQACADNVVEHQFQFQDPKVPGITIQTIIFAAWALIVSRATSTEDVIFGVSRMDGNATSAFPLRVQPRHGQTVSDYLKLVQKQAMDLEPFERTDLQQIISMCPQAQQALPFQTALVMHEKEDGKTRDTTSGRQSLSQVAGGYPFALVHEFWPGADQTTVKTSFDSRVIDLPMVDGLLRRLALVVGQMTDACSDKTINDIRMATEGDLNKIWNWNASVPQPGLKCARELFETQVSTQSEALAICAWDGELTYGELNQLSTTLASRLVGLGVASGVIVPLLFEKSMWTTVAVMAVLKAGGAFVILDPALPEQRLINAAQQVGADKILCSSPAYGTAVKLAKNAIAIDHEFFSQPEEGQQELLPYDISSLAYVVFTSGSTGTPKGVMIGHQNLASALHHQPSHLGLKPGSRVFDFSAYSFDMSIYNLFATLCTGGCLCVPNEQDRQNDLSGALAKFQSNFVIFTPSIAQYLSLDNLPNLETVLFIGEALKLNHFSSWWGRIRVINTYGPAECTPISTINHMATNEHETLGIGKGTGSIPWVVDPENHHLLVPVGSVGELLLEGPCVGKGYLGDEEKTNRAFINDPKWLLQGSPERLGRHGRLYKTGDLVKNNPDGTLAFVGRKDAQVKINGQRVELGEIEHWVRKCIPEVIQVAVDLIVPAGETARPTLAAFLQVNGVSEFDLAKPHPVSTEIEETLTHHLPRYMMPSVFFYIEQIPLTPTGKRNRRRLQEIGGLFSSHELASIQLGMQKSCECPITEMEKQLQSIWASVLNIKPEKIGLKDNFFRLGGSSIDAMKVVSKAREIGIELTVADIFRLMSLGAVAGQCRVPTDNTQEEILPFSLMGEEFNALSLHDPQLKSMRIQDAYPCTPLQEGLFSLSTKSPGDYVMQNVLELSPDVSISRFCDAWQQVARNTDVLRTRMTQYKHNLIQVVVDEDIHWIEATSLDNYLQSDKEIPIALAEQTTRYAIIRDSATSQRWFVLTIHHALYDGWSLPLIIDKVNGCYKGQRLKPEVKFNRFVKYIKNQDQDEAEGFWRKTLDGYNDTPFPALPASIQKPTPDKTIDRRFPVSKYTSSDITTSTLIRSAWALIAGCMANSDDVLFGATVIGRNAPVPDIDEMLGPTIATVPIRTKLSKGMKISDYLNTVQSHFSEMIPYEQTGLQRIADVSAEAMQACAFQTLLIVQPQVSNNLDSLGKWQQNEQLELVNTYALAVELELGAEIVATARFDSRIVEPWIVEQMLEQLESVLAQLEDADFETRISDIKLITERQLDKIWEWNADTPTPLGRCAHELIEESVKSQPDSSAVSAWDGQLTYSELDDLASRLATNLVEYGVGPDVLVPLCFDKSMWTPVAILAVLKAGGGFVLLDRALPTQRLQSIVDQTGTKFVVSSTANMSFSSQLAERIIEVGQNTVSSLKPLISKSMSSQAASTAMCAVFTSGSTGVPKGVVLTHDNFCSGLKYQSSLLGFAKGSRVYDFASYSFDIAIHNAIATFVTGGCLCIPSDEDRKNNISDSIAAMKATIVDVTPSVAPLIDLVKVPDLKTLILAGEAVSVDTAARWWGKAHVINAYGPAECGISTVNANASRPKDCVHIGKGAGLLTWVVDPENHHALVPPGCIGELLLEGPLVGRGYLNEPEKTAAVFISDPVWMQRGSTSCPGRGGRLYKTGDLVRYNHDGSLLYLGRKDAQVKIRGQRVELGEVEHRLRECLHHSEQVCAEAIVPQGQQSTPLLAAFIQISTEQPHPAMGPISVDLETQLAQTLPNHMIPSVLISMRKLPMGVTGKIDRKQLREIGGCFTAQEIANLQTSAQGPKKQLKTDMERQIQQLWAQVLKIDPEVIGLDDSFLQLGGNSIIAMRLAGEAKQVGINLTVADLFRHPRLHEVASLASVADQLLNTIPRVEEGGPTKQSFAQERLWFVDQLHPGLTWYLLPYAARVRGKLDIDALNAALAALEFRHETLRTTFLTRDGAGFQEVHAPGRTRVKVINMHDATEDQVVHAVRKEQETPFDLRVEPGLRVHLYRLGATEFILTILMHHIVCDGWSIDILRKELAVFYSAALRGLDPLSTVKPLPIQYQDYSVWQKEEHQKAEHQCQLEYWVEKLETSRPAEFLYDKPRPAALSGRVDIKTMRIEGSLFAKLQKTCGQLQATPFAVLLAAFRATHYRMTGQVDATIGYPNANRKQWELKNLIGFFVNLQCIRIQLEEESFEELVKQVQETIVDSFDNQDVPFDKIVAKLQKQRDLSRHPLVQLAFAAHSQLDLGHFKLEGLEMENLDQSEASQFDLEFHFFQEKNALRGEVYYSTDLFLPETIDSMLSLDEPKQPISLLRLLDENACSILNSMELMQEQLNYPRDSSVVDLFSQQVGSCPSRIAVKDSTSELSYAQLDVLSDNLASWLRGQSLKPETLVGVFFDRCCEAIVAFLGILKANLAYLPLDVKTPVSRMETILSSVEGRKIILFPKNAKLPALNLQDIEFVEVSQIVDENKSEGDALAPVANTMPSPTSLAYVMFTSGSTGKPKGVMAEHRGIVRLAKGNMADYLPNATIMCHMSNVAFDAATWEIYSALLNGGTLVCIDSLVVLDLKRFADTLVREKITSAVFTTAFLKEILQEYPQSVSDITALLSGGDRLDPHDVLLAKKMMKMGQMINAYGPTENTSASAIYCVPDGESLTNGVPIGRAITGSGAYVMDPQQQLVPLGVLGELVLTGDGVSRGYTDPERNIDRFITVSIAGKTVRAYRTGDYVRYRPVDGQLEYFGRIDQQVKIRGHRVEIGEIEQALRNHNSVTDAVVVLHKDGQNTQLAGFVTVSKVNEVDGMDETDQVQVHDLQKMLKSQLPPYMIPQSINILEKMPINKNGKVDRQALQAMTPKGPPGTSSARQPTTEVEHQLQEVWGRILNVDALSIGLDDNFFQLGGHSITAMKLVSEARKIGLSLEVADIFRQQTLQLVASQAKKPSSKEIETLKPFELIGIGQSTELVLDEISSQYGLSLGSIEDAYPCTPLQEGIFTLSLKRPGDYINQATLELPEDLSLTLFCEAWEKAVSALPILRTRIIEHHSLGLLQITLDDSIKWASGSCLNTYLEADRVNPMSLGDRLSRYALIGDNKDKPKYFVWTLHHALYDGWSLQLILKAVNAAFQGMDIERGPQLQKFVKYVMEKDEEQTSAYWQNALGNSESAIFPSLPRSVQQPAADTVIEQSLSHIAPSQDVTAATQIHAAWALVVGRMTNSDDVTFGVTLSGRNAPVVDIDQMIVPAIATVPFRVKFSDDQPLSDYLQSVQRQAIDMVPFEQTGIHKISRLSSGCQHACTFQTLILVQLQDPQAECNDAFGKWEESEQTQWFNTYGLVIEVFPGPDHLVAKASFDSKVIERWVVEALLERLDFVLMQMQQSGHAQTISEIEMVTQKDAKKIWAWNHSVPSLVDSCVDEMVEKQAIADPDALAVHAWDGDLTYSQLDYYASGLANRLLKEGVKPDSLVPLCFEKSKWTPVAALAVLKAGGAFALLDPTLPEQRLNSTVQQLGSRVILSSTANLGLSSRLASIVVEVSEDSLKTLNKCGRRREPQAASTAMYVVFTSGSTGLPKGVIVTHANFASVSHHQSDIIGYDKASRVFDFASYAFDVSVYNIFVTFLNGGCLCIPSDADRKGNIAKAITDMRVTIAEFTPSVARLIEPRLVPGLKTLMFGGEAVNPSDAARWCGKARVLNTYGPAECTVTSTINVCSNPEDPPHIGTGAGATTWVVHPSNHSCLLPPGCIGELLLEGPLVARGYLNDQEKTAAAFIDDPSWLLRGGPGRMGRKGRLYKTGDLVRYRKDGSLEFIGRKDSQVKIHGQRIEVGEIEHWLQEYTPEASRVVVEVIHLRDSGPVLAAFLHVDMESRDKNTLHSIQMLPTPADVEDQLTQHLPAYMVPTVLFHTSEIPVGNTGKIDRKRLREIGASFTLQHLLDMRSSSQGPKRQPICESERQMQMIWAQVLDKNPDTIGLDDSFFHLGGNSIDVMKVVGAARRVGLSLTVASIFQDPRLHEVARQSLSPTSSSSMIQRTNMTGPFVTSFAQSQLLFLEQLYTGVVRYNMPCIIRIRGPLHHDALNTALRALETRHETLRTRFSSQEDGNLQIIQPVNTTPREIIDISSGLEDELLSKIRQDEVKPFDLSKEAGWRVSIYRMDENHHVLSIVMHHIISDGWSIEILRKELGAFYSMVIANRDPLSSIEPLPIQYKDYSIWQKEPEQVQEHRRQEEYWFSQLETSQPAELPCDKPRPTTLSGDAGIESFKINGHLYNKLQNFCKSNGVTPFMGLLAAFRATQYRLTGQSNATIGSLNANRDRWEVKDVIGFFVNLQALRIDIEDETFEQLVQQVQSVTIASFANQDMPFENIVSRLQRGRDISRNPIAQICFSLHPETNEIEFPLEGLETELIGQSITTRFDIEFHLYQQEQALQGEIVYSTDLYVPETMKNLASTFPSVLEAALDQPNTPVSSLPLLTETAYSKLKNMGLIEMPRTDYPRDSNVVDIFRQQASMNPHKIAVKDQLIHLTYSQLDEQSDALAQWLLQRGYAPETLVGVLANRSCHAIITFLGILKANLAYLPFDVKIPAGRFKDTLSSLHGHKLVLVGSDVSIPTTNLDQVEFVPIMEALSCGLNFGTLSASLTPSATSLAYVMFTSGSTGKPKGVMIEHRGIVRLVKQSNISQYLPSRGAISHVSSVSFDTSIWEIYGALLNGLSLVCIDAMTVLDPQALARTFIEEDVRSAFFTPLLLKQIISGAPTAIKGLESLYVGGEHFSPLEAQAAKNLMAGHVINSYGPTENTTFSTIYRIPDGDQLITVPIGQPLSNSHAYVMDSQQRLVPLGVVGELVVTGDGLARGYTDPERNIDRFVLITIDNTTLKAYRTGDYARYRVTDGQIECLGRMDSQVKIRGQRVEIEEIEHVLRCHSSVEDAVTVIQYRSNGEAQLASFITASQIVKSQEEQDNKSTNQVNSSKHLNGDSIRSLNNHLLQNEYHQKIQKELKRQLRDKLPPYMVPDIITILDKMPMNNNGKVDRQALTTMVQTQTISRESIRLPYSKLEHQMQSIWAQVLGMEPTTIGLDDGFFQLGGNSITAMKLVAACRSAGLEITMQKVFKQGTLEDLAKQCRKGDEAIEDLGDVVLVNPTTKANLLKQLDSLNIGINSQNIEDILPTTSFQEHSISQADSTGLVANYMLLDLDPKTNLTRLENCCRLTLERFPLLRSHFLRLPEKVWQVVLRQVDCRLRIHDVSEDVEKSTVDYCDNDKKVLSPNGLPTAFALLRHKDEGLRLTVRMSHAQYDGYSMATMLQSLMNADETKFCDQSNFSRFLSYAHKQRGLSIKYWGEVLEGSSYTSIQTSLPPLPDSASGKSTRMKIETTIRQPPLPNQITLATLVSTAWGVLLARLTGSEDVNFGHVVASRNSGPVRIDKIVGPCVNYIPMRLKLSSSQSTSQSLLSMQQQFIAPDGADSLGFRDIIDRCTSWPAGSFYNSLVQHQNVDENPEIHSSEGSSRMTFYEDRDPHNTFPCPVLMSYPKGDFVQIQLLVNTDIMTEDTAQRVIDGLCRIMGKLCESVDEPLLSWAGNFELAI